jgi:hypothetical protein
MNPSELARQLAALRKTHGPKPKLSICSKCGKSVSARAKRLKCPHVKHEQPAPRKLE